VANAVAKDETGDIKITLWNDEIDRIKGGDRVSIQNGYVSEWQGELQVSTGRFGKIEVVGESSTPAEKPASPASKTGQKEEEDNSLVDDEEDVI